MAFRDKSGVGAAAAARRGGQARVLRIIGGAWRGRKLRFPASHGLRPTPDRVRETLFNWLAARAQGARCLDLFAGSGALGLEALSRGAAHATFVERDVTAARELAARLAEWGARDARVERTDALLYLAGAASAATAFDLVFLDPPFDSDLLPRAAALLERGGWLKPGGLIYVECAARGAAAPLPPAWTLLKAKQAGEVGYHLYARAALTAPTPHET
ncbi:MAG: 16S rRNA (guanine(966)-N(2))-methyltransferase RsmD [Steroidobacteraceae bacterium]